ncbi:Gfo/Idh/MocA family protein [Paenilisteria newyorkensis]|uniref:Gfo/Idh/MocA family protein n=1 Tax=Listeria newyorkensis TaxID=1497681 RepID=UPI000669E993|nr:Gfo/Idh/MocA family oxidoreductase [Listeria newyorkensis]KMT62933.1 Gfo/Idh/MocA family oxidoreductase [Listeria newyorkensis]
MKKVAIIGAGQVAEKVHAAYYKTRTQELELVAVVDPDAGRARDFAEQNGFARSYVDAAEMFEAEKPDMVSICTPNRFHFDNVMLALSHGAAVMCEKPPAMTANEAQQMRDLAAKQGLVLAYDFHHRFATDMREVKQAYADGVLGEVYMTKAKALRRSGVPGWGSFTNKALQGGGPLIDIGIHMLDAAMYVLDFPKVKKVTAKMFQKIGTKKSEGTFGTWDPAKYDVEDAVFAFIEFENGGLLQLETSFVLQMKEKAVLNVEFFGDEAGATLFPAEIYTDRAGELVTILKKETADEERHAKSMQAFVDRVLGAEVMVADGEQGYQVQRLIEAIYESAEKGESVYL